ncbi:MAG TPA: DUF2752 domain-containing protein [Kofleriaceae bacterium]|nr:DUF2752 domain-containing protein [Kofleriaceae bacterium]
MIAARVAAGALALATLVTLAVGAFAPASWQAALATDGPGCPFKLATGIDCPFCGMTRATIALGRGDVHAALGFHPFAPLVLVGLLALFGIVVVGRAELLVRGRRPIVLLAAIALLWALRLLA